jgi:hypothetical protein
MDTAAPSTGAPLPLDLADAELSSVHFEGGVLALRFAAVRVKPATTARGEGARYLGGLVLLLADAHTEAPPSGCIGRVADAVLQIAGQRQATLAAPLDSAGPVRRVLQLANGARLAAEGSALSAQLPPGATVAEHYHC